MTDQMPLLDHGHGWNPDWPAVGTVAREDYDDGKHSVWIVIHGRRAPRWYCLDSTAPGRIGETRDLDAGTDWTVLGRTPGTPIWPVSASYKRIGAAQ